MVDDEVVAREHVFGQFDVAGEAARRERSVCVLQRRLLRVVLRSHLVGALLHHCKQWQGLVR
ncbi:hypothetical protein C9J85_06515 [Haloferax sp. wsp5]|nr:hypothetical protein C9J85_06515 [Haloferax sp. wsp5]